jgi:DNA-binding XRE family transcriptional regulator
MMKKIKKIVESYPYEDLGFPVLLKDVLIVKDRDYEYALINHRSVMNSAAFGLVMKHEALDGQRLKFLRRFINYSLDDLSKLTGIAKTTLHAWEKESDESLEIPDEKLKLIFLKVRDVLAKEITDQLDGAIIKAIIRNPKISPIEIAGGDIR